MGKKKWKKPSNAIVKVARTELAPPKPKRWFDNVGYKIIVGVTRRTVGMEVHEKPSKVIGQALGLRNDGHAFFAKVDLPWVWGPQWLWQPIAERRLATFLSDECLCVAKDGDTLVCKLHESLNIQWNGQDANLARMNQETLKQLDNMPIPGVNPGPLDMLRVIHLDYPWCRYDVNTNEWACLICSARCGAGSNNSSFRNQFIFKHAECGNALRWDYKPKVAPDVRERTIREVLATLEQAMQRYGRAPAAEKAYQELFNLVLVGGDPKEYLTADELDINRLIEDAERGA